MADTAAPFSNCPALAGRKIMLIEADEANRQMYAWWLEKAGMKVSEAKSLEEARGQRNGEAPDLIWLGDVPEDKLEMGKFCTERKNTSGARNTPVVVVTSLGASGTITKTFFKENGADAVFHKSQLSMQELLGHIHRLVPPSAQIEAGGRQAHLPPAAAKNTPSPRR